jgi:hypothetical protein
VPTADIRRNTCQMQINIIWNQLHRIRKIFASFIRESADAGTGIQITENCRNIVKRRVKSLVVVDDNIHFFDLNMNVLV